MESWADHPTVKRAEEQAKLAGGDGSVIETLSQLSVILNELEDRFPGMPFAEILAGPSGQPPAAREAMRAAGVSASDVVTVCGPDDSVFVHSTAWGYADMGCSRAEMAENGATERIITLAIALQSPMSERETYALQLVEDGFTARQIAEEFGVSRATRWIATQKAAYAE